ncbi:hypothetical protein D3C79_872910 [compost metagenome]
MTMVVGTDLLMNPILMAITLRPFTQTARTMIVLTMDNNRFNESVSCTIGETDSVIVNMTMEGILLRIMDTVVNKATILSFASRTFFRLIG